MSKRIAVIATLDTKGDEANFIREELQALGATPVLIDIGVIGEPTTHVDISKDEIARAAGSSIEQILENPTRQTASEIMIRGASSILIKAIKDADLHAVIGLGGTQGTPNCAQIMQQLPYGFPKIILSTVASGDTAPFMGIKDITMMPAVGDILGLNPFSRKILANLAGAAFGMSKIDREIAPEGDTKGTIGMTNLGVLTEGSMHAIKRFNEAGYEVITFHAVGTGGRSMEQMMREGVFTGVFDYALGEIADDVFEGLRAADDQRLSVAGELGIPQVICPGGAEHLGYWVNDPNTVPEKYKDHKYVFHNPYVFVPRLNSEEITKVGEEINNRLAKTPGRCRFLIPTKGVSRYSIEGGELYDPLSDQAFFDTLEHGLPDTIDVEKLDWAAEDPRFIDHAVDALIELIEEQKSDKIIPFSS